MKSIYKKSAIAVTVALVLGIGAVGKSVADSFWSGHQNIVQTGVNIDKLTSRLQTLTQQANSTQGQIDSLNNQLKAQQKQYSDLSSQKDSEEAGLQQQIQDKISEGNNKVAEKQKEVDSLNQKINDLNNQISQATSSSNRDLGQAVSDAQSIKDKSDQAVNNYVK